MKYLTPSATYTINVASAVNCTSCHQPGTSVSGINDAPVIPDPLKHSSDNSGQKWGDYWTTELGACNFCHGDTKHNATAMGYAAALMNDPNNAMNSSNLASTYWCADCHYTQATYYSGDQFAQTPPAIDVNNTGKTDWINHTSFISSSYSDSICNSCHALNGSYTLTTANYIHSLDPGTAGGPDCVACHDIGGSAPKHVDVSAMKSSIHANLNSGATNTTPLTDAIDKACWACHGDGSEPSEHPATYKSPKVCEDCHTGTAQFNAPLVAEHFYAGEDIVVTAGCRDCHSKTEMLNTNSDPDAGSVNATISHYGKPRNDLVLNINGDIITDCYYCHQNATSAFKNVMQNANHSYMYDHSDSTSSPKCWNCHSVGRIHDQSHQKPSISNSFCLGCHQSGIGSAKPIPTAHNATMSCYSCHMEKADTTYDSVTAQIHGIKYINADGSYTRWDKSNAANCADCHMNQTTSSALQAWGYSPPSIPSFNHSNDMPGQKWGSYWTSTLEACTFCHQGEIHKATNDLLGNITYVKGSNVFDGDISGTWCANCHYTAATEYNGTALSPLPPRIDVDEGTANDGTAWVDHSSFLSSGYTDDVCKQCHGSLAQSATLFKDFVHAVSEGTGGGCIACHSTYTGSIGIVNTSYGRHVNVNVTDGTGNLSDADCTTCHYDTSAMFDAGFTTATYSCSDCHINGNPVSVPSDVQLTAFQHGNNDCKACHIAGGYNASNYYHWNYSTPYGAVKEPGWEGWSGTVTCQDCHYSHSKRDSPFFAPGIGTFMATKYTNCGGGNCHGGGTIHNSIAAPYMYPPTVSISLDKKYAFVGETINVTAEITGYAVQIYNASYRLTFNGTVIAQGQLTPLDGEFGGVDGRGYGYEKCLLSINTTGFEPGEYRIYVTGEKDTGLTTTTFTTFTLALGGIVPSPTAYNFGFEDWTVNSTPVNWVNVSAEVTAASPRTGNYSALLTSSAEGYLESAKFNITARATYRITVYVSKPSDGGFAGISVLQWNGSSVISETPKVKLEGYTSDWVLLGIDIVADSSATDFSVRLYVNNTTAYFDDVSVIIKPFVTTNHVINGGFESNWGSGKPDKYFRSYEYRQSPYESIKAWEPKAMASNGMDINTSVAVGTRAAGIYGSGYWTTPYADITYGTLYKLYQQYYAINLAEGTAFTAEFMVYADSMNGFAGISFVYRTSSDVGDNAGQVETYRVGISETTDWITIVTSGKMPAGREYLQLKLLSEGSNHAIFDEVAVY